MPETDSNNNSDLPKQKLICPYCQHENEVDNLYCSFCSNNLQFLYDYQPSKPRWWKLPVFFIIYCIFGLILLSNLAGSLLLMLFVKIDTLPTVVASNYEIIAIDIVQVVLILVALKFFKGFQSFFKPVENNQDNSITDITKVKNKLYKKSNFIRAILFILLLMSIILVIENTTDPIIQFFRNFFHLGPTKSAYATDNNHLIQYFYIIFFADCIFAPIIEETIFRGFLQQALNRSGTSDFSHFLIQGITFSLAHLAGDISNGGSIDFIISHMIFTFTFAICSTFLRKKFNSLIPSILLHSLNNSIADFNGLLTLNFFIPHQKQVIGIIVYALSIALIVIIVALLYLFDGWKPHIPLTFKQNKNQNFTFRILFVAVLADISQYLIVFLPAGAKILYFLGMIVFNFILFIYWANMIHDIPWKQLATESKNEKSSESFLK